ncbi:hypothetical protein TNCV_883811 [Trichonephila clavipes]|nr:hypothetical protein TNCV_883811 [Trichonephila clavipes]
MFYMKEAPVNSIHCIGLPSHMWTANDLNEVECRPVVTKTYPQCQGDKSIYSPLMFNKIQFRSWDALTYCFQAPMMWD